MTSASPSDSLRQATKPANYQAHYATSFVAVLIAVFSIGCCANCMQPVGLGMGGAPQGYTGGYSGGYPSTYPSGGYSSAGGQLGYGRPDTGSLPPPTRVTPWDPYTLAPGQSSRPSAGRGFGGSGYGGVGGYGTPSQNSLPQLPPPTGNPRRIYTPPASSTDWTPLGTQSPTLRTPGFRDTRWPF